ncbi:Uncharacterised protein [Klebsiella pneumoniae]|nr:Uncharacterised protein [Klebsiella pneumoniae]
MPATTAWRGSRGRLMIRNSWGFQTDGEPAGNGG